MADNLSIYKTHHIANATPSATVSTQTSGLYHALAPVFLVRIVQDTPSPPFQTQQVGPSVKWAFFLALFFPLPADKWGTNGQGCPSIPGRDKNRQFTSPPPARQTGKDVPASGCVPPRRSSFFWITAPTPLCRGFPGIYCRCLRVVYAWTPRFLSQGVMHVVKKGIGP